MTDKQIACIFLSRLLSGFIPDHYALRETAETKLTEERCYRITQRIIAMAEKMRAPLVQHLNNTGVDAS